MENILKETLVEQARLRDISIRSIHEKIEELCAADNTLTWISESTLERRFRDPRSMSNDETNLIRLALKKIMSEVQLVEARHILSDRQRKKAEEIIEKAVEMDYALISRRNPEKETDKDFINQLASFYAFAPEAAKEFWHKHLKTYLDMPNIAKASIMCSAYIGKVAEKNDNRNEKIKAFLDYFPFYESCMVIADFPPEKIYNMGKVLQAVAGVRNNVLFKPLRKLAYDKKVFSTLPLSPSAPGSLEFIEIAKDYKARVGDYPITAADFAHTASFILFIDETEWLLGYASSLFANKHKEEKTTYYDKGCTGFKFSEAELGYLCELVEFIEGAT